jgi:hypothetical protein
MLQALGELNLMVASGMGGLNEWSLRFMLPKTVLGMWQFMQTDPGLSALWPECSTTLTTRSSWHFLQASFGLFLNLSRPLEVWHITQWNSPLSLHTFIIHPV